MLFRMYARWVERKDYKLDVIDYQPGDEAGIKGVTFTATGEYAFGYMRSESGVHRLVRISPFDSNKRRHTSFAALDVVAELGPTGDYLQHPHTMRHIREPFYSDLMHKGVYAQWENQGKKWEWKR